MEAKAQQLGFTTKVVVKATYTPSGLNEIVVISLGKETIIH